MPRRSPSISIEVPKPTDWIENKPEGTPPAEVLLLMLGWREIEEDEKVQVFYTGYFSEKLNIFLETSGLALEEEATITHYHIVHDEKGNIISMT